jgi:hypothetical protein
VRIAYCHGNRLLIYVGVLENENELKNEKIVTAYLQYLTARNIIMAQFYP